MLGGTETFHYNLAEALTAAGHEVIFFSMYDERNIPCGLCWIGCISSRLNGDKKTMRRSRNRKEAEKVKIP